MVWYVNASQWMEHLWANTIICATVLVLFGESFYSVASGLNDILLMLVTQN